MRKSWNDYTHENCIFSPSLMFDPMSSSSSSRAAHSQRVHRNIHRIYNRSGAITICYCGHLFSEFNEDMERQKDRARVNKHWSKQNRTDTILWQQTKKSKRTWTSKNFRSIGLAQERWFVYVLNNGFRSSVVFSSTCMMASMQRRRQKKRAETSEMYGEKIS